MPKRKKSLESSEKRGAKKTKNNSNKSKIIKVDDEKSIKSKSGINYWLFKSEPETFGVDDLSKEPNQTSCWDGVRNFQARNILRSMKRGDKGFFYHSNAKSQNGIVGTVEIVREAYPDSTALDPASKYYDSKHTEDCPIWFMVDVRLIHRFPSAILLSSLKEMKAAELEDMMLLKRGSRLSVQPVSLAEWNFIEKIIESHEK